MEVFAVEVRTGHIKMEYVDGSREEVSGLIYERKNANGDTVEERIAVPGDTDRLVALASSFEAGLPSITALVTKVEVVGDNIEIKYADGTKEEIENGIYERKNSDNETIVERAAGQSDIDRLLNLASDAPNTGSDDDMYEFGSGKDDDFHSGSGDDSIEGKGGHDRIRMGDGNDTSNGGAGDDNIRGGGGNDDLNGGSGKDRMRGGADDDTLTGGNGDDRIRGDGGNDVLDGGGGHDRVRGDRGDDTLSGGNGDDRVRGNSGNDVVDGGAGDDRVRGDRGDDTVNGGEGSDRYYGGQGADVFVFAADGAQDKIHDFQDGVDLIDLQAYGFTSAAQFLDTAFEDGGDTYINLGGGDVLKLDDVSLSDLSADDFIL